MAEKESNLIATAPAAKEEKQQSGSLLGAVARFTDALTRGFWETVVRQMHVTTSVGEEFLRVISFLIFSGIISRIWSIICAAA